MSDERRAPWTKAGPQLLCIAVLAIVFVACLRDRHLGENPLRHAAHRLRAGMSIDEALSVTDDGLPNGGFGSLEHLDRLWFDKGRGEVLCLHFERSGSLLAGNAMRLTKWGIEKLPYQSTKNCDPKAPTTPRD
jgi:hypothetical protein